MASAAPPVLPFGIFPRHVSLIIYQMTNHITRLLAPDSSFTLLLPMTTIALNLAESHYRMPSHTPILPPLSPLKPINIIKTPPSNSMPTGTHSHLILNHPDPPCISMSASICSRSFMFSQGGQKLPPLDKTNS